MSYTRFKTANFTTGHAGLGTVGYQFYDTDGNTVGGRTVIGVTERGTGTGIYGALVTFDQDFTGEIRWDSGVTSPVIVSEAISPTASGLIDYTQTIPTTNPANTVGASLNDAFLPVTLDLTQHIPLSNAVGTSGEALSVARAHGAGLCVVDINLLTITYYAPDGVAVVSTQPIDKVVGITRRG